VKREFCLELWLGTLGFGAMFLLLLGGALSLVAGGGYIFFADEPVFFKLFFGGFVVLLLIPTSYGVWGTLRVLRARHAYRRDFLPRMSDVVVPTTVRADVAFFGRWPQVGAYRECVLEFPSGKAAVTVTPKFVSSRAYDAIVTTPTPGSVTRDGETFWRDGVPYLFRDETFRLWF
jgi:hypothetical protein